MKWQNKLTKKELKHVKEWCDGTLRGLRNARTHQNATGEKCYECQKIAKKLGLEK